MGWSTAWESQEELKGYSFSSALAVTVKQLLAEGRTELTQGLTHIPSSLSSSSCSSTSWHCFCQHNSKQSLAVHLAPCQLVTPNQIWPLLPTEISNKLLYGEFIDTGSPGFISYGHNIYFTYSPFGNKEKVEWKTGMTTGLVRISGFIINPLPIMPIEHRKMCSSVGQLLLISKLVSLVQRHLQYCTQLPL